MVMAINARFLFLAMPKKEISKFLFVPLFADDHYLLAGELNGAERETRVVGKWRMSCGQIE
jgi:hypothetical protein